MESPISVASISLNVLADRHSVIRTENLSQVSSPSAHHGMLEEKPLHLQTQPRLFINPLQLMRIYAQQGMGRGSQFSSAHLIYVSEVSQFSRFRTQPGTNPSGPAVFPQSYSNASRILLTPSTIMGTGVVENDILMLSPKSFPKHEP